MRTLLRFHSRGTSNMPSRRRNAGSCLSAGRQRSGLQPRFNVQGVTGCQSNRIAISSFAGTFGTAARLGKHDVLCGNNGSAASRMAPKCSRGATYWFKGMAMFWHSRNRVTQTPSGGGEPETHEIALFIRVT